MGSVDDFFFVRVCLGDAATATFGVAADANRRSRYSDTSSATCHTVAATASGPKFGP